MGAAHQMFEKYDVTSTSGVPGEGGEYNVQSGFGWTNGAVFELLTKYCSNVSCLNSQGQIQVPVNPPSSGTPASSSPSPSWVLLSLFLFIGGVTLCILLVLGALWIRKHRHSTDPHYQQD